MESTNCSKCQTELSTDDVFCVKCGYPENGTDDDKGKYNLRIGLRKKIIKDANKKLKNVKILFYVLAGLNALIGIFFLMDEFTFYDGVLNMFSAIVFLACVAWVNKKPLMGVLAGFVFWIVLQLLSMAIDPATIFQGVVLKIIFVGIFIKGITSAKDYEKYQKELSGVI